MKTKDVNTIISKYLDGEATLSEETFLLDWIKNPTNREYFEDFIKTQTWVTYNYGTSKIDKQLKALSIDAPVKGKVFGKNLLKYAALVMVVFSAAFFLFNQNTPSGSDFLDNELISLEVNDGASKFYSLENLQEFSIVDATVNLREGQALHYYNNSDFSNEVHTIHVPYGKIFKVILADGSIVKLNSGSRFSYPASFDGQDSRTVSLVGEAYFDITKSKIPFRVNTENLTTEVLGTQFNISAYKKDTKKEVILVEGSVQISQTSSSELKPKLMMPNQKATVSGDSEKLLVETITIEDHLGWTSGALVFYKDNMTEIFKKLERKFNIRIENNFEKLESLHFTGRFAKRETLEEVLGTMRAHTDFSYTISETNILLIYEPVNLESQ